MLEKLISFSLRNKVFVLLITIALIIYGSYSISKLPIDSVPDITNNQVQVITVSPSFGAIDIERQVTAPLESTLSNIPGLVEQRSFSRFGLSIITLVFQDDIDIYLVRQQVSERLSLLELPKNVGKPFLAPVSTGLGEIYQYVVKAKKGYEQQFSITDLRTIQDWVVRRNLLGTEGVAEVSSFGGKLKQYVIEINPEKLASMQISISELKKTLQENNANSGGGYLNQGNSLLVMRTEGILTSIDDIENLVVKVLPNGVPVKVRDIGQVNIGFALRYGALSFNGETEVAGGIVMMLKGENSSKVITDVKKRILSIQKLLPEGVEIEAFLDRTKMVNNAIGTVLKNLFEGAVIVVFILVLFLGTIRAGLVVASVIPLSMLIAVILMNLFGVSGNLMSLGALDFGLIVDGAVIIVEALMHRLQIVKLEKGNNILQYEEMDKEVKIISKKMMNAAVFGQLIIMMVYVPILTLEGIEGKMFKPMAQTVAFAIFGAFILSVTYVPVISSLILNTKSKNFSWMEKLLAKIENAYLSSLQFILNKTKFFILFSILLFLFSVFILSRLGGEFIPELEEGDFAVETRMLPGTNLETAVHSTKAAAALLKREFSEVEKVVVKTGSAEIPTDPMPIEASDLMVILKPKGDWVNAESYDELAEKMSQRLNSIPEISTGFQYPVQMRFNELISGAKQDVVCKVYGENLDTLTKFASQVASAIRGVDGLRDLYVEPVLGLPQIVIDYDHAALSRYNVSISDLNEIVNSLFAGESSGQIYEGEKRFDLTIKLKNRDQADLSSIGNIPVKTGENKYVPMRELAQISYQNGPVQIQRESARRRITIGFNVRGRDVETVVNQVQLIINQKVKMPDGYMVEYGGQFENLNAAKARLSIAVPVALSVILLLLFFSFSSLKYSFLVFSAIPLSLIGGVFALWVRDMPFSISAGIGFIALFGVAVLNGIVMMSEFIHLEKNTKLSIREIIFRAASTRLRPVIMTALVASLGFFPMAFSTSPGSEVQRPLATVVIGGLVTSTVLTLYMLPSLFYLFEHRKRNKNLSNVFSIVFLILFSLSAGKMQSQKRAPLSLQEALDCADRYHPSLKILRERIRAFKNWEKSTFSFPKTAIQYEYGSINSAFKDSKWSISQSFEFPAIYFTRKKIIQLNSENQKLELEISKLELQLLIKQTFARAQYSFKLIETLEKADSVFSAYNRKIKTAVTLGELNAIQQLSAENVCQNWKNELSHAKVENQSVLKQLQLITGLDSILQIENDSFPIIKMPIPDAILDGLGSSIRKNYISISSLDRKEARSLLLPDFNIGFYNQSITGFVKQLDGSEKFYRSVDRFNVFTAGLQVPLFFYHGVKKNQSLRNIEDSRKLELEFYLLERKQILEQALADYAKASYSFKMYSEKLIPTAYEIIKKSSHALSIGEINYLEWTILNQQSFETIIKGLQSNLAYVESGINLEGIIKK